MNIVNNTALLISHVPDKILVHVFYEGEKEYLINKKKTYRRSLMSGSVQDDQTHIFIHEINDRIIRESHLEIASQQIKATNIISFWEFVKNEFKSNKHSPQTVGKYKLSKIDIKEPIKLVLKNHGIMDIQFELPPWVLSQHLDFQICPVEAQIEIMNLYPRSRSLDLILSYSIDPESEIYLNYGDAHENY